MQAVASAASCVSPGMRSPFGDVLCQLGFSAQLGSGLGAAKYILKALVTAFLRTAIRRLDG